MLDVNWLKSDKGMFFKLVSNACVVEYSMDLERNKEDQILALVDMMGWFAHVL